MSSIYSITFLASGVYINDVDFCLSTCFCNRSIECLTRGSDLKLPNVLGFRKLPFCCSLIMLINLWASWPCCGIALCTDKALPILNISSVSFSVLYSKSNNASSLCLFLPFSFSIFKVISPDLAKDLTMFVASFLPTPL